eukprot:7145936-Pyramimonas_sp.AAC.1
MPHLTGAGGPRGAAAAGGLLRGAVHPGQPGAPTRGHFLRGGGRRAGDVHPGVRAGGKPPQGAVQDQAPRPGGQGVRTPFHAPPSAI